MAIRGIWILEKFQTISVAIQLQLVIITLSLKYTGLFFQSFHEYYSLIDGLLRCTCASNFVLRRNHAVQLLPALSLKSKTSP
jgi:hypothetical protein